MSLTTHMTTVALKQVPGNASTLRPGYIWEGLGQSDTQPDSDMAGATVRIAAGHRVPAEPRCGPSGAAGAQLRDHRLQCHAEYHPGAAPGCRQGNRVDRGPANECRRRARLVLAMRLVVPPGRNAPMVTRSGLFGRYWVAPRGTDDTFPINSTRRCLRVCFPCSLHRETHTDACMEVPSGLCTAKAFLRGLQACEGRSGDVRPQHHHLLPESSCLVAN
jgi:hypothetical protein